MTAMTCRCRSCGASRPVQTANDKPVDGQVAVTASWTACEACGSTGMPEVVYAELTTYPPSDATASEAAEMGA